MQNLLEKAIEASEYIKEKIEEVPDIAIILGSGLAPLANKVEDKVEILYSEIPNFPTATVAGHGNKLIFGKIANKPVLVMQGRFHYYEGYDIQETTFPIKVFKLLGISQIILSNAAGGLNKDFKVGELMLINDHISLNGLSPLRGKNYEELGPRFPSMTNAYTPRLLKLAKEVAKANNIDLSEGVYAYMPGPQYETKAEIKALTILGADAVGMSTAPEVVCAAHSGLEVLGISCITNLGFRDVPPSHEEVLQAAKTVEEEFQKLVIKIIEAL